MAVAFSFAFLAGIWTLAHWGFGSALVPSPLATLDHLSGLVLTPAFWEHLSITVFRGTAALAATVALALVLGMGAGRARRFMDLITPLVAVLQSTPPILWITLVMVWAGTGNAVPVLVVIASLFPPLFMAVAMATASLDKRLFHLVRLYRIRPWPVVRDLILPGIFPHFMGGVSFALGSCLKVAAVAEFLGADRGVGARIYWTYRMMDMEGLFSWALVLVGLGVGLDLMLVRPLRLICQPKGGSHAATHTNQ